MQAVFLQTLLVALCLYVLRRLLRKKTTFSNLRGPPSESWLTGCLSKLFGPFAVEYHKEIIGKYGTVVRVPMQFGSEAICVADPLAMHHIFLRDQYIYEETPSLINSVKIVLGPSIGATIGEQHRKQRKILSPVFSIRHMKDLLSVFYPIAYDLRSVLAAQIQDGGKEIDMMHWVSRAALEAIGQGGFGYVFNALHDEKTAEYGDYFKKVVPLMARLGSFRVLSLAMKIGTPAFRRKVLDFVPSRTIKEAVDVVDILDRTSKSIYQERKRALENRAEVAWSKTNMEKDVLTVLMKYNMEANENDRLSEEEVLAQVNTFVFAGQDTTSHAVSRALHQLSLNPKAQVRLREEVIAAQKERGGSDFDYDSLMALPYLDSIVRETLRLFPPVIHLNRETISDVIMPLAWPVLGSDGRTITEVPLKKGTGVLTSIIGVNTSKKIWGEDAEEWKPERWLGPLPETVGKAHLPGVYSNLMTFIGGGRACLGFKFAEMEMKLFLAVLLESFELKPGPEIEWRSAGLTKPVLKHSADKTACLPLKVAHVKNME